MRSGIAPLTYRQEKAGVKRKTEANEEALLITFAALFKRFMAKSERKPNTVRHYYWVMESVLCDWSNKPVRISLGLTLKLNSFLSKEPKEMATTHNIWCFLIVRLLQIMSNYVSK